MGTWTSRGFNTIWRPNHTPADQDRFLELNLTSDQIEFSEIPGPIPNRGDLRRGLTGITQQMVNNPNSVLTAAIAGQHITSTTTLHVTTIDLPTPGGGTANTAFLKGGADGPNATAVSVTATFWLETLQGQSAPTQLQYTQTVLLNFNGISWPHVTVGTLHKA